MSKDWCKDINDMHTKYGVRNAVKNFDSVMLRSFLRFRLDFLHEELGETENAAKAGIPIDAEEVVDGLIDLCVVAIGTLDALGVDAHQAWDEVHQANMSKEVGVKETRPNPLGLPDLVKPTGWIAPSHDGNHGLLNGI
jgi:predicted HAD superfamily Cof-like phosphohydrolase